MEHERRGSGDYDGLCLQGESPNYVPVKPVAEEKKPVLFVLPKQAPDNRKIWNYLKGRGICRKVFDYCVDLGILYESAPYHNVVFVGKDRMVLPDMHSCVEPMIV